MRGSKRIPGVPEEGQQLAKFLAHVEPEPNTGCWLWTSAVNDKGYGTLRFPIVRGVTRSAHRVAWELLVGQIPDGVILCHRCDVRLCVNPDHLFLGDWQANASDMAVKGRGKKSGVGLPYGVGVINDSKRLPFRSKVTFRGRSVYLGSFKTADEASLAAKNFRQQAHEGKGEGRGERVR